MRIWTPTCASKQYWVTLFFRETGERQFVRVGRNTLTFGKGPGHAGKLARVQIEVKDGDGSIELFPGAVLLGVVISDKPGVDARYQSTLNPEIDEVELVRASEIITMPADLARDVAGDNPNLKKQIEVLNGQRKRVIAK